MRSPARRQPDNHRLVRDVGHPASRTSQSDRPANSLILAEEYGIDSGKVGDLAAGKNNPEINRILGAEGKYGAMLRLEADWIVNVNAAAGNFAEIFDRHIGPDRPIGLTRGVNASYRHGGILHEPPIR